MMRTILALGALTIVACTSAAQPSEQSEHTLTLRVTDEAGEPVRGVSIGRWIDWSYREFPVVYLLSANEIPQSSDEEGVVRLTAANTFGDGFQPLPLTITILGPKLQTMAEVDVAPTDIPGDYRVTLEKAATINGRVTWPGMEQEGQKMANIHIARDGDDAFLMTQADDKNTFEVRLLPGTYTATMQAYADGMDTPATASKTFTVPEGAETVELLLEAAKASPTETSETPTPAPMPGAENQPKPGADAPELAGIEAWKNGGPYTLEELRGKVVLLDFWGYWCGPCVVSMPNLMAMHDTFKDDGLVVIGIHEGTLESLDQLPELTSNAKAQFWGGRDIPFTIALDGGDEEFGLTHVAYAVNSWPTSFLIDREGRIIKSFHPGGAEGWSLVEEALGVSKPMPDLPERKMSNTPPPAPGGPSATSQSAGYSPGSIYALEPQEKVKYIYPPFSSQRNEFANAMLPDAEQPPNLLILAVEDRTETEWPLAGFAYVELAPLRFVLQHVVGLEPWQIDGDERALETDLMGDWVIQRDTTTEERMMALETVLRNTLGLPIAFEVREAQRDAVVVGGALNASTPNPSAEGRAYTGALGNLLRLLSGLTGLPFINKSEVDDAAALDITIDTRALRKAEHGTAEFDAALAELLASLSQQTGLTLSREETSVSIWHVLEKR